MPLKSLTWGLWLVLLVVPVQGMTAEGRVRARAAEYRLHPGRRPRLWRRALL